MRTLLSSTISKSTLLIPIFALFLALFAQNAGAAITYISSTSGRNDALPNNGSAGALTIAKPAGVVAGQALIASIAARPKAMTFTAPAGWIQMTTTQQDNGGSGTAPGGMTLLTFYKIVTTTDPVSYTWTFANSNNTGGSAVGGILAFSGIDTTSSPINVFSFKLTTSGFTHSTNPITTTVANTMIVSSISYLSASNFGTPTGITGLTEIIDQSAPVSPNGVGTTIQMATAPFVGPGSVGGTSATAASANTDADNGIGHLMALRPAAVDTAITMTRSGNLVAGGTASYTLTISNNGSTAEPGPLTVINTLPTGLTYVSSTGSGSGWSCSAAGQVVTCTRTGAIAAGASAPALVINVTVASSISGTVTNTATVSGTGGDGNSANNTAVNTYVFPSVPYAYYAMEETTWGSGTGVVTDSSGNGRNASALGSASPTGGALTSSPFSAIPGNPGTCGAGQIPNGTSAIGVNTAIDVNSIGNTGTIMFWYSSNQGWNNGTKRILFDASNDLNPNDKHFFLAKDNLGALNFALEDSADTDSTAISPSFNFPANEWHHIAVTWDFSLNTLAIYLDGNTSPIATSTTTLNGSLGDMATLYLGAQRMSSVSGTPSSYTNNTANGYIDEVRFFQGALSPVEIAALADQTHACPSAGGGTNPANFECLETGLTYNNLTATPSARNPLYTKLVGSPFNFDVVALKSDGTQETGFVSGSTTKTVTVELVNGSGTTACASRTALTPAVSQSLTFASSDSGRKAAANMTVNQAYPNVRCRLTDANQTPSKVDCSTDNFAIRPTGFTVSSTNANADALGSNTTATPAIKTGVNFSLTAASGAVGYNTTPKINSSAINAHTGAAQTGSLVGSFNSADSATGTATGTAFTYSEVGYFNLGINGVYDDTFTAVDSAVNDCTTAGYSNTLVGGKYGCNFGNTAATAFFGRFIPDHFAITPTSVTPACSPTFTYFGQDGFSTLFTLTAQNSSNSTTRNYQGGFARLGLTTWANFGFSPASALPAGSALSASATAPVGTWAQGVADVVAKHQVSRPTALTDETNVTVNAAPVDPDGVTMTAAAIAPATPLRYGRVALQNAYGSELLDLAMPMTAEYWNGTNWTKNTDDSCSSGITLSTSVITGPITTVCAWDSGNPGNSGIGCTTAGTTANKFNEPPPTTDKGNFNLNLKAPGANITGSIDITATVPSFLQFNWQGTGNVNPTARATFGIYKGNNSQIYLREVY